MPLVLLLVPSDPLAPRRPDDHFAPEAAAAHDLGIAVALVDHDDLDRVHRVPESDDAVYRGWMVSSDQYAAFASALAARGTILRTPAAAYRTAHELPGWYPAFREHTPRSVWTSGPSIAPLTSALGELGSKAAVLRDHVKSAKHDWHEAAYVPDTGDLEHAAAVAGRLHELRGDDFTGGFVARTYEDFDGPEVRTWWIDGECRLVTAHPDTPDAVPSNDEVDTALYAPAVAALGGRFVTVDLVRRTDGTWRVVEVGDGQVSDRPPTTPPHALLSALAPPTGR